MGYVINIQLDDSEIGITTGFVLLILRTRNPLVKNYQNFFNNDMGLRN